MGTILCMPGPPKNAIILKKVSRGFIQIKKSRKDGKIKKIIRVESVTYENINSDDKSQKSIVREQRSMYYSEYII